MKSSLIFKLLLDFTIFLFIASFGYRIYLVFISAGGLKISELNTISWVMLSISLASFVLLTISFIYFRSMSRGMLIQNPFESMHHEKWKKTGNILILIAIVKFIGFIIFTLFSSFFQPVLYMIIGSNPLSPFIFMIIGLFFRIQSRVLKTAYTLKQENEQTI